jgi:hypothetical protein
MQGRRPADALDRIFGPIQSELAEFDLRDVEHRIDEAQEVR